MIATVNGTRIAYTDEGKGFPLMFLHGSPAGREVWSKQIDEFKTRFRVIAPDLRGFGESAMSLGPTSLHRFARDLHALMEHLVTGPVVLAGQAMGGLVALAYASAFPRLVRGLVLVGMRADGDRSETAQGSGVRSSGERKSVVNQGGVDGTEGLCVPTLVIAGSEDVSAPADEALALAHSIPGARFILIPNAGHLVGFEQPAAFNQIMRNWLAWGSDGLSATHLSGSPACRF